VSGNADAEEVIRIFDHLFEREVPLMLPANTVITDYVPDADYRGTRDGRPAGADLGNLPESQRWNYGELFDDENGRILYSQVPLVGEEIARLFGLPAVETLQIRLPDRMRRYSDWIVSDFDMILGKRLQCGKTASLLEDLLAAYRAGFFPYGWTGSYPNDVKLLVFSGGIQRGYPAQL
jgi:hypothetical protein